MEVWKPAAALRRAGVAALLFVSAAAVGSLPHRAAAREQQEPPARDAVTAAADPAVEDIEAAVRQALRSRLAGAALSPAMRRHGERALAWEALLTFYARRDGMPAWSAGGEVGIGAARFLGTLPVLTGEGLDTRIYPQDELPRLIGAVGAATSPAARVAALVDLEIAFSYTFLAAGAHLAIGRVQPPELVRIGWHLGGRHADLVAALEAAQAPDGDMAAALLGLAPRSPGYRRLREALAGYREIAARGGWPAVPPGRGDLRLGQGSPQAAALAARLAASGEASGISGDTYDAPLAAALAAFQATHGLESKQPPRLDAATLAELNVPVGDRICQIELSLERWRWIGDPGDRFVLVNIPQFQLSVIENHRAVLTMKVIVGRAQRRTPVFSDTMTQLVLNPAWHIPDSISAGEIAPAWLRDPAYLRRKGYEVQRRDSGAAPQGALDAGAIGALGTRGSPYRLVQPPGPGNAPGRYKFVFPNQFDIYLHDTPTGPLFARAERDFSTSATVASGSRPRRRWRPTCWQATLAGRRPPSPPRWRRGAP